MVSLWKNKDNVFNQLKKEVEMNIKKFLILSCIALQLSTIMYADQAAWNEAFNAFGGINSITMNSHSFTSVYNTANGLKTPEALAVGAYLSNSNKTLFKTTFTSTDVVNALNVAKGVAPAVTPVVAPVVTTPVVTPVVTPVTPTTTDTAATALKSQINASIGVLNSYNATKGIATVAILA